MKMKLVALLSAVALVALFASCELFDPPPSDAEVATATTDLTSGMNDASANYANATVSGTAGTYPYTVTIKNTAGTVTLVATMSSSSSMAYKITYASYVGSKNTITGTLDYTQTVANSKVTVAMNGKLTMKGSTVRSLEYKDISATSSGSALTYTGNLIVNDIYKYDANTNTRIK